MSTIYLTLTAKLPNGQVAEVTDIDLEEVWEKIDAKTLCDEFEDRCANGDKACLAAAANSAPEDFYEPEPDEEMFRPLDAWARAELLKAIREDDGRRCIDVLKRAAVS